MASHSLRLSRTAQAVYLLLFERDRKLFDRMRAALEEISQNPRSGKPLKGAFAGQWSFRVGQYRIIYRIEEGRLIVLVLDIGHRRDIYR
ncbi:MAG: type II toxin-antitoxin system RelE/ParE family toxin [Elusimicrobiota bacterium]